VVLTVSAEYKLAAGDYVEIWAFHDSSGAVTVNASSAFMMTQMVDSVIASGRSAGESVQHNGTTVGSRPAIA
jgi:hypothetical protein